MHSGSFRNSAYLQEDARSDLAFVKRHIGKRQQQNRHRLSRNLPPPCTHLEPVWRNIVRNTLQPQACQPKRIRDGESQRPRHQDLHDPHRRSSAPELQSPQGPPPFVRAAGKTEPIEAHSSSRAAPGCRACADGGEHRHPVLRGQSAHVFSCSKKFLVGCRRGRQSPSSQ